jgi:Protein of unknown function, DUF488
MGQPVRISLGIPRWKLSWELPQCLWPLTPRGHYFHDPPEEFARKYLAQLEKVGAARLHEIFTSLTTGEDPLVFLCFERDARSGDDCHRRQFADWWLVQTGEYVPELGGQHAAEFLDRDRSR